MKLFNGVFISIGLSIIIVMISNLFGTELIYNYLKSNLIGLLITLMAINIVSLGILSTRIQAEISSDSELDFAQVLLEMKFSIREQLVLIAISIAILTVCGSERINIPYQDTVFNILLTSVLIYAINILWDIAKSILLMIERRN